MRRTACAFVLQLCCLPTSLAMADQTVALDSLQWKHRVLLLPKVQEGNSGPVDWPSERKALLDRDLVLFRAEQGDYRQLFPKPSSPTRLELPKKIQKKASGRVTLIGKDGGVKRHWTSEFPELPAEVFALIDSMPMRQREMRREKEAADERSDPKAEK